MRYEVVWLASRPVWCCSAPRRHRSRAAAVPIGEVAHFDRAVVLAWGCRASARATCRVWESGGVMSMRRKAEEISAEWCLFSWEVQLRVS